MTDLANRIVESLSASTNFPPHLLRIVVNAVLDELDLDTWRKAYDESLFPPIDVRDIKDPECRKLAQRASAGLARHMLDRIMGVGVEP